jgi:hypothetical protein
MGVGLWDTAANRYLLPHDAATGSAPAHRCVASGSGAVEIAARETKQCVRLLRLRLKRQPDFSAVMSS